MFLQIIIICLINPISQSKEALDCSIDYTDEELTQVLAYE